MADCTPSDSQTGMQVASRGSSVQVRRVCRCGHAEFRHSILSVLSAQVRLYLTRYRYKSTGPISKENGQNFCGFLFSTLQTSCLDMAYLKYEYI
jgi:hypothetical protein